MSERFIVTLGLGAIGAALGFFAFPATIGLGAGLGLGLFAGSVVSFFAFPPPNPKIGGALQDNSPPASAAGQVLPFFRGHWLKFRGLPVHYGGIQSVEREVEVGKDLTPTADLTENFLSFSVITSEGSFTHKFLKMWADAKPIYDTTALSGPRWHDSVDPTRIGFYDGHHDQPPSPVEEAAKGLDISAHKGMAKIWFEDFQVDEYGRMPIIQTYEAQDTTDLFPSVIVDESAAPGVPSSTSRSDWYADGRHFLASESNVGGISYFFKYDSQNNARVATRIFASGTGQRLQALNPFTDEIYTTRDIGSTRAIYAYDPDSLDVVARAEDGLSGDSWDFLVCGGTLDQPRLWFSNPNHMNVYDPSVIVGSVSDTTFGVVLPTFRFLGRHDMDDFFGYAGQTATASNGRAIDGDGNCWATYWITVVQTEEHLVKFRASDGAPEEIFVLTDVDDGTVDNLTYHAGTNSLVFEGLKLSDGNPYLFRFSLDTETIDGELDLSAASYGWPGAVFRNNPKTDHLYLTKGATGIAEISLVTMTEVQVFDIADWTPPGSDNDWNNSQLYDYKQDALVISQSGTGNNIGWFYLRRVGPKDTTVQEWNEALAEAVGLTVATDTDMAAGAADSFSGVAALTNRAAAEEAAEINTIFRYNGRQVGDKIKLKKRTGTVDRTLLLEHLGMRPVGSAPVDAFTEKRPGESPELPAAVQVNARSLLKDGDAQAQIARVTQEATQARAVRQLNTNAVISEQQAVDFAAQILRDFHSNRVDYTVPTCHVHSDLVGADVIKWPDNQDPTREITAFVAQGSNGADNITEIEAFSLDEGSLDVVAVPEIPSSLPSTITVNAATASALADIPLVQRGLTGLFLTVIAGPTSDDPWRGVIVETSSDGVAWQKAGTVIGTGAQSGVLHTALPAHTAGLTWQHGASLTFSLTHGTLASQAVSVLPEDATGYPNNGLLIRGDTGWIVVVFQSATDNGDGTWTVTDLMIGLRNTALAAADGADQGRPVYVIEPDAGMLVPIEAGQIGAKVYARLKDIGSAAAGKVRCLTSFIGLSDKPYPVKNIGGSISSNDWLGTFDGQSQNQGPSATLSDMESGILNPRAEVVVYSDATFTTEKRTITTTATANDSKVTVPTDPDTGLWTFKYDSADQVADFGSNQTTIYVGVYLLGDHGVQGDEIQGTLTG